jgi:hypothetical protein
MRKLAKAATALSTIFSAMALSTARAAAYYTSSYSSTDDAAATGIAALFTGGMIIIPLCCGLLGFLVWVVVAFLIYKDAQKNNVDNPILWAIVVWFTGVIGILIYLLAIRNKNK